MGFFSSLGELYDIVTDGAREITEMATEGFVEMVIKGNNNYKTSYGIEAEANQKIHSANSKYKEGLESLKEKINATESRIIKLGQQKADIQTKTIAGWVDLVRRFQAINYTKKRFTPDKLPEGFKCEDFQQISTRVVEVEKVVFNPIGPLYLEQVTSFGAGSLKFVGTALTNLTPILSVTLNQTFLPQDISILANYGERSGAAKEYLSEAKSYASDVELALGKMGIQEATLLLIQANVDKVGMCLEMLNVFLTELMQRIVAINARYDDTERRNSSGYRKYLKFLGKWIPSFGNKLSIEETNIILTSIYTVFAINNLSETCILNEDGYPDKACGEMIEFVERLIVMLKGDKI